MAAQVLLQTALLLLGLLLLVQESHLQSLPSQVPMAGPSGKTSASVASETRRRRAPSIMSRRQSYTSPSRTPRQPSPSTPPSLQTTQLPDFSLTPGASTTSASTGTAMLGNCTFATARTTSY
ncbi:adhesion G protein-coupled receptor G1 [Rhinolophus ferrumequinum]|uniref:Adhesion G protein-coupled receptor G1 n=1 Tax=Rhinolophus ferrumequinum TaxID=59479 RepID=A0A7J7SG85_RHIFE|nr:adhesion G protein-coupled receptor G1 [Rhinolophus ferrumequinum]